MSGIKMIFFNCLLISSIIFLFFQTAVLIASLFYKLPSKKFYSTIPNFVAVIPAHNEGDIIYNTVRSFYKYKYDFVVVVADKCKDNTISEASRAGAFVFRSNRGNKFLALKDFIFSNDFLCIPANSYIGFFDADSNAIQYPYYFYKFLDKNAINQMGFVARNKSFLSGLYSYLFTFGFLFNMGSQVLFKTAFINGTAFFIYKSNVRLVFSRSVFSLVDDFELGLKNFSNGFKTVFVHIPVISLFNPFSFRDAFRQRLRWARGFFQVLFSRDFLLFFKNIHTLVYLALPLSLLLSAFLFPVFLVSYFYLPAYFLMYFLPFFVVFDMFSSDLRKFSILHFLYIPFFMLENSLISLIALFTYYNKGWYRSIHSLGGVL